MIYDGVDELVGKTPLLNIKKYAKKHDLRAKVFAKLEYFNPSGSVKDRVAKAMIEDAEAKGLLTHDSVIIEPTSGNTGIGLAAIGAAKGYRVILTMPETMSVERRNIIKAYGAEIVLTEGAKGMKGAIAKAEELAKTLPNAFIAGQFVNPANPRAHYLTTGPEIWNDTDGKVDILVAGVGTGGTLSGTGKYLKEKNPNIKVIAVEPETSPVLSKGVSGPHKIQGIGAGFIPDTLDTSVYDEIITVNNEVCFSTAKELGVTEGVLVGISSGAALWAAISDISDKLGVSDEEVLLTARELQNKYDLETSGINLLIFNNKLQFCSNPANGVSVETVLNPIKERELSKSMLETAAIIAYKQPVTRTELDQIRGVNSDYALQSLMKLEVVEVVGRKDAIGKPLLYGTTDKFLKRFQISSLDELPDINELMKKIRLMNGGDGDDNYLFRKDVYDETADPDYVPESSEEERDDEDVPDFLKGENVEQINM